MCKLTRLVVAAKGIRVNKEVVYKLPANILKIGKMRIKGASADTCL